MVVGYTGSNSVIRSHTDTQCGMQSACNQVQGTCLGNQLDDLTRADLARVAAGTTPLYLVGRYGGGVSGASQVY